MFPTLLEMAAWTKEVWSDDTFLFIDLFPFDMVHYYRSVANIVCKHKDSLLEIVTHPFHNNHKLIQGIDRFGLDITYK